MKKDLAVIFGLFFLVVVLLIFGRNYTSIGLIRREPAGRQIQPTKESIKVTVKTLNVQAKVAKSDNQRKEGLSKLDLLPLNEGMIFVFDKEGPYAIWMKNMKFAIDVIWIDKDKKIVDIAQNVPPQPNKKDRELTIYRPSGNALYVLEINAGLASLHNLQPGDQVNFDL